MTDTKNYGGQRISDLPDDRKLDTFKEWLKLSSEAFEAQRRREKEDLQFQEPENQWTPEARKAREGRPMISISLTQGPLQHVYNQAAAAHFGVDLKPISEKAQTKLADIKKGMYSRIQRDGDANHARMWAFDRASQCGLGWYRIITKWDEDSDNPSDQEIAYERILYQEMVYPDPAAIKPDFSDGRFLLFGAHIPLRDFKALYPKANHASAEEFAFAKETSPDWVRASDGHCEPFIAEVFYKETVYENVRLDTANGPYERIRERSEVRRAVVTALEVIEDNPWLPDRAGKARQYIPFVPVIGVERQPVDGKRRWEGMVRGARDGQRAFNFAISQTIEDVSSSSKAKYMLVAGQVEGFKRDWDELNLNNRAYVEYNAVDAAGKPAPAPQLMQVDGTKMQLSMALAQQARELVQTATQGFEPMEVPRGSKEQSGVAIARLEMKADAGRSHYTQNFKDISLPLDARIVLDMMPVIYDRPGRVIHILGIEDESKPVMLNAPYVVKDGRPVRVPEGDPNAEAVNLAEGKYAIVPVMGRAPQTRLQEGQEFLAEVMKAAPDMVGVMGDLAFQYRDEPGAKEIAERLKRQIQQNAPYLLEKQDGASVEQAKAENQALKAQLQQVTQQAGEMAKALETDQARNMAQVEIARLKVQAEIELARMNNAAKIRIAEITATKDVTVHENDAMEERLATGLKIQADKEAQASEHAHDVAMAAAGAHTVKRVRDRGQEQDSEQGHETSQGASEAPVPEATA